MRPLLGRPLGPRSRTPGLRAVHQTREGLGWHWAVWEQREKKEASNLLFEIDPLIYQL
jgi:hypothetical protein